MAPGKLAILTAMASAAGLTAMAASQAQSGGGHPVAVELFTSQGCSSCPPADAVLARIVSDRRVVAITRPVTYWDRLGWKDTLAKPANTDLQRAYAQRKLPGHGVYTPQAVVQGRAGLVGSRGPDLLKMVIAASARPEAGIAVRSAAGGRIIALSGKAPVPATVSHVALKSSVTVRIGKGENGGRNVTYTNVLVGERAIGRWRGGAQSFTLPAAALNIRGADRHAVIVRQGHGGPILAARYL